MSRRGQRFTTNPPSSRPRRNRSRGRWRRRQCSHPRSRRLRRRRRARVARKNYVGVGIFAGVVVAVGIVATMRSNSGAPSAPRTDSAPALRVAQTGEQTPQAGQSPIAPVSLPTATARVPERPASTRTHETAAPSSTESRSGDSATPKSTRDVFKLSITPQSPMHVGESATLHANIEHTSGTGPVPRVTWISNKPAVVRIDPITGAANAVSAGQAVVRAIGGGARADIFVSVLAAAPGAPGTTSAPTTAVAPAAEVAHPAAPPTADDARTKAADALRDAANNMVAALKAKDGALATPTLCRRQQWRRR